MLRPAATDATELSADGRVIPLAGDTGDASELDFDVIYVALADAGKEPETFFVGDVVPEAGEGLTSDRLPFLALEGDMMLGTGAATAPARAAPFLWVTEEAADSRTTCCTGLTARNDCVLGAPKGTAGTDTTVLLVDPAPCIETLLIRVAELLLRVCEESGTCAVEETWEGTRLVIGTCGTKS